jgi:NitT/TauT family transport system ATP-binding protein
VAASYLSVAGVQKTFETRHGSVEVLKGISLSVERGEFVSILGPSGCGKSTLLMMCGGLESATAGEIEISGAPVTAPRSSTGILFQDPTLLPWMSVLDNVLFPIRIMKRPLAKYTERAAQLLELVGLVGFECSKPHQLSGGMKQRVALCRALIHDPDVLLMDEPFSALDALTRDDMNIALLDIWQRYRQTALFVTHSIREAVFLSDRVLVMTPRPGRIMEDVRIPFGRPREFSIGETVRFNEICAHLRTLIGREHRAVDARKEAI